MAVYKVIQDIEAEDKLLGPLTLKGFIYALIASALIFINVRLAMASSLGSFRWGIIFMLLPPIILFGVLASPFGKDQPTEVWLLSHVRFFLKPRRKIWSQSGILETVTITAPKAVDKPRVKDITQTEVKSRLRALADTLDSRGWAIKNIDVNLSSPSYFETVDKSPDRLISPSSMPQTAPVLDIRAGDDILDEGSNAKAKHFKEMVQKADRDRKKELVASLSLAESSHTKSKKSHRKAPPSPKSSVSGSGKPQNSSVTPLAEADKMELAKSGNAFSVASLQRLANRHQPTIEQVSSNEVVINLH